MTTTSPSFPSIESLFRLDQQVALVTGGANGIGAMAAQILARAGARVIITDLDEKAAQSAAQALTEAGHLAQAYAMDVSREQTVVSVFNQIIASCGRLDILVNSAGTAKRQPTIDVSLQDWNRVVAVNLTGTFLCCREAGRQMLKQRSGSIINVASIMGHSGGGIYPNPSYHATKGAVINLTRALAAEWAGSNIRVNDIAPTFVHTRFTQGLLSNDDIRLAIEQRTPMGRIAEVDDLAGAILYLASPAAKMVTGHSLAIDGGWLAC